MKATHKNNTNPSYVFSYKRTAGALALAFLVGGLGATSAFADHHKEGKKGEHSPEKHSPEKMITALFEKHDADKNGEVTLAEMQSEQKARFQSFDADGNGEVTLEELPQDAKELFPGLEQGQAEGKGRRGRFIEKHANRMALMGRLDKDGNEVLSEEEFLAPVQKRFEKLDVDGNGSITKEEAAKGIEKAKESHGGRGGHRKG